MITRVTTLVGWIWFLRNARETDAITQWMVWKRRKYLGEVIRNQLSNVVSRGPFAGMKLSEDAFWGETDVASQLLGIYEQEVLIEITASTTRRLLLNLGSADGYYSVGWSLSKFRGAGERCSIAFEISPQGQEATRRMALLNGVEERVSVSGEATSEALLSLRLPPHLEMNQLLILSDIEGAEYDVLTDEVLHRFRGAKWIIEVHEFNSRMQASLVELIVGANRYYQVRTIRSGSRNPNSIDELLPYPDVDRWLVCAEGREGLPGKWLVLD